MSAAARGALLVFADVVLDPCAHAVTRGSREVALSPALFRMLGVLMECPGQVLSGGQLHAAVWGGARLRAGSRAVDMAVVRLRAGLEAGGGSRLVHTVRGVGFVLRESTPGRGELTAS